MNVLFKFYTSSPNFSELGLYPFLHSVESSTKNISYVKERSVLHQSDYDVGDKHSYSRHSNIGLSRQLHYTELYT